jgi:hypothetical protein
MAVNDQSQGLASSERHAADHDARLARLDLRTPDESRWPAYRPTAHGGRAEDAFHLVLPTMPGYGLSGKPRSTGWDPERIARAWTELMSRL